MEKARADKLESRYNNVDIDMLHSKFLEQRSKLEDSNKKLLGYKDHIKTYEEEILTIYELFKKFSMTSQIKRELLLFHNKMQKTRMPRIIKEFHMACILD